MDDSILGEVGKTDIGDVQSETPAEKTSEVAPEQTTETPQVPFSEHPRWKEVYSKAQKVDALEKQLADLQSKVNQPAQEEWQPKTWSEVRQKSVEEAVKRVFSELQRQQEAQSSQQQQEDQALEEALGTLKAEKGEFDQKKLLETAWKYKQGDLSLAYDIMQLESDAEKRGEKQALRKTVAPIGSSKKTEGGAKATTPYNRRRTLDDIVADAAERISQ